jgi:hypothetical protein
MAGPRVFISSTYYDLKHVRASLQSFVRSLGFEPVLSEKGDIAYDPARPLDESCYREARNADILVMLIGGRYGSVASTSKSEQGVTTREKYDSITKKEFEAAFESDIPCYILIERAVFADYETFRLNRDNGSVNYAHVDSLQVLGLIDDVVVKRRNNPVFQFEHASDIEGWLRDQWSGHFRELLSRTSSVRQMASLAAQVGELAEVNQTLRRYLEEVVSKVSAARAGELIAGESQRLADARTLAEFTNHQSIESLVTRYNATVERAREAFNEATSLDDLASRIEVITGGGLIATDVLEAWRSAPVGPQRMNEVRTILGKPPLAFGTSSQVGSS